MQVITEIAIHACVGINSILRSSDCYISQGFFECQIEYYNMVKFSLCLCLPTQLVSE